MISSVHVQRPSVYISCVISSLYVQRPSVYISCVISSVYVQRPSVYISCVISSVYLQRPSVYISCVISSVHVQRPSVYIFVSDLQCLRTTTFSVHICEWFPVFTYNDLQCTYFWVISSVYVQRPSVYIFVSDFQCLRTTTFSVHICEWFPVFTCNSFQCAFYVRELYVKCSWSVSAEFTFRVYVESVLCLWLPMVILTWKYIPRPVKSSVLSVKTAVGAVRVMPLACSVLR